MLWSGQEKTETFTVHNYSPGSIFAVSCELLCTEQGDGYISFSTVLKF